MEQVAAQPRGPVDDHRIEAPSVPLLGLPQQLRPPGPIVPPPGLLVGELADDLPAQLLRLRRASLPLRGKRESRVLLVLGRQPPVPGKAPPGARSRPGPLLSSHQIASFVVSRPSRSIVSGLSQFRSKPPTEPQPTGAASRERGSENHQSGSEGGGESDVPMDQREQPSGRVEAAPRRQSPDGRKPALRAGVWGVSSQRRPISAIGFTKGNAAPSEKRGARCRTRRRTRCRTR